MNPGDHVRLCSDDEIICDDSVFEWDCTLLFRTREDARDMIGWIASVDDTVTAIVLEHDSNFIRIFTSSGCIGWTRKHYWRIIA